jgi:hypothetical protein
MTGGSESSSLLFATLQAWAWIVAVARGDRLHACMQIAGGEISKTIFARVLRRGDRAFRGGKASRCHTNSRRFDDGRRC